MDQDRINKDLLLSRIIHSGDLTALEKRYLEKLVAADGSNKDSNKVESGLEPGDRVYVIIRDEDGDALEIELLILLGIIEDYAFCCCQSARLDNVWDRLEYMVQETAEWEEVGVQVYPASDCYKTEAVAREAMSGGEPNV